MFSEGSDHTGLNEQVLVQVLQSASREAWLQALFAGAPPKPPQSRVEGKSSVNVPQMLLPLRGSI